MITLIQEENIRSYVDRHYFDVEKLIQYLSIHTMVGPEVFKTVTIRTPRTYINRRVRPNILFEEGFGFEAIPTDVFIRRIPFYFYLSDREKNEYGDLTSLIDSYHDFYLMDAVASKKIERYNSDLVDWEPLYERLEKMFYDFKLDVSEIMCYTHTQSSNSRRYDIFDKWYQYLDLIFKNHVNYELKPCNLLYSYNKLLEELDKDPILYGPSYIGFNELFVRKGNEIEISGEFPINPETNEVEMRWVLIWIEESEGVKTIKNQRIRPYDNTLNVTLSIKLGKKTRIYLPSCSDIEDYVDWESEENIWKPIYIGPQAMVYDETAIKRLREERKMTQKEVADMIDVKIRTYQNWEIGLSKPDTLDLIKLMNLFDIYNVQELIKSTPIFDPYFKKFKTGCPITFFAPIE